MNILQKNVLCYPDIFDLSAFANKSYANGKGGVYLNWTDMGNNIIYKVYQKSESSNEYETISTYEEGDTVQVLNIYPPVLSENKNGYVNTKYAGNEYMVSKVIFTFTNGTTQLLAKSALYSSVTLSSSSI